MYHWDMILFLIATEFVAIGLLIRGFVRLGWTAMKFFVPSILLGVSTELLLFSLKSWGSASSGWWNAWLFFHLPASLALDPLHLPPHAWAWTIIALYSLVATAVWFFVLTSLVERRKMKQGLIQ